MANRRTIIFPSVLFAIFFVLVAATGFFQIRIIKNNLEGLLKGEGEIVYNHVKREIDINLEYLDLLEKTPAIITPNFLNIMISDEGIVDNLYNLMSNTADEDLGQLPLSSFVVYDKSGKMLVTKGKIQVPSQDLEELVSGRQSTVVKTPAGHGQPLVMGMVVKGRIFFFRVDADELRMLRKKFIIQDILEREEKRFSIVDISIYDEKGASYLASKVNKTNDFVLSRPLASKYLPGYTLRILISGDLARDTLRRTALSFVLILLFLLISGALSTFVVFYAQRKYEKKMAEMQKELQMKERLVSLGRLASGMAHEIRNPLNAMGLSVQRLKREFLPQGDQKEEYLEFLDIIRGELVRVDKIVEDFLISARAHAPFLKDHLQAILDEVVIILREKTQSKGINLNNESAPGIIIECQKDRLKQAFYNVILNAIEAIEGAGEITIQTKVRESGVELSIRDTGPGIDEDKLEKIFEYYYTTKDKGVGLGLPISYMIIKDHGGDMRVSSVAGHGATFVITLPVKQEEVE